METQSLCAVVARSILLDVDKEVMAVIGFAAYPIARPLEIVVRTQKRYRGKRQPNPTPNYPPYVLPPPLAHRWEM